MPNNLRSFGETVQVLKEMSDLMQRQVTCELEIDIDFLSKMEWNEKRQVDNK